MSEYALVIVVILFGAGVFSVWGSKIKKIELLLVPFFLFSAGYFFLLPFIFPEFQEIQKVQCLLVAITISSIFAIITVSFVSRRSG